MSESSEFRDYHDAIHDESEQSNIFSDASSDYNDSASERIERTSIHEISFERTLAIIKPDAMEKVTEIEDLIKKKGFSILQKRKVHFTPEQASDFYSDHYGKIFFPTLIGHMSSAPIVALVLSKASAVKDWLEMVGHVNPFKAKEYQPHTLRAIYGKDHTRNAVHSSENRRAAEKEITFLFRDSILEPVTTKTLAKDYLTREVQPTLLHGLTAVSKIKPVDPITWLADWLIENNPRKPKVGA